MSKAQKVVTRHGVLVGCQTHKKRRTYKPNAPKPTNGCAVCNLLWLSDRLETSIYSDDAEDVIKFHSTVFTPVVKAKSFQYIEEANEKC